jgi:hypothetical protein
MAPQPEPAVSQESATQKEETGVLCTKERRDYLCRTRDRPRLPPHRLNMCTSTLLLNFNSTTLSPPRTSPGTSPKPTTTPLITWALWPLNLNCSSTALCYRSPLPLPRPEFVLPLPRPEFVLPLPRPEFVLPPSTKANHVAAAEVRRRSKLAHLPRTNTRPPSIWRMPVTEESCLGFLRRRSPARPSKERSKSATPPPRRPQRQHQRRGQRPCRRKAPRRRRRCQNPVLRHH